MKKHITRRDIYRKFLKAKGRYLFWYAINLNSGEQTAIGDKEPYKKIIEWILEKHPVRFRCGFAFNMKRGDDIEEACKERVFDWDPNNKEFILTGEAVYSEHQKYYVWGEI